MKAATLSLLLIPLFLNGCHHVGQGTPGPYVQTGTDRAEGSTPYALGRTSPFMRSGMPDVNVADSRIEAGLATSPSGRAELSRRAAAATVRSPWEPHLALEPEVLTLDEIVLDRIWLALSATTQERAPEIERLSIQTLHNLQITSRDAIVTLGGRVETLDEKQAIEAIVQQVEGVQGVRNELVVNPALRQMEHFGPP
jgi:hypothetical protein